MAKLKENSVIIDGGLERLIWHSGNQLMSGNSADKPPARIENRFYWAEDTRALYRDNGAAWEEILRAETFTKQASDSLSHSNDAEKAKQSGTYVKAKETKFDQDVESLRLKYEIKSDSGSYWVYCSVRKNGVEINGSTEAPPSYATKSHDLGAFSQNDTLELWLRGQDATYIVRTRNMRLYANYAIKTIGGKTLQTYLLTTEAAAIAATNQDP